MRPPGAHPPGAHPVEEGTTFVVWSTTSRDVAVRLFEVGAGGPKATRTHALDADGEGRFEKHIPGVRPGALYKFVLDGDETPDPYARFMPYGVHGPARVVSRERVPALAIAQPLSRSILYEVHVGTFSPEGTYRGAEARLDELAELGITTIELLPVAAFPGHRGWGYDGVALYAPFAAYGELDDLRSFVRAAHARGMGVVLDVVYNHFGPSGNYLARYAPEYFTQAVQTPWGAAPDFGYAPMRRLVLENVRYWLEELGFDGLRLDATHAIHDDSKVHVLREISDLAHGMSPPRRVFFEDDRNEPSVVYDLGADAIWADDFHHQLHVLLTGERDGYYDAYAPTVASLARAIDDGFSYTGQPYAPWNGRARGSSARPRGCLPEHLVYCIQNHDQIGNRAFGARLGEQTSVDAFCAASVLLLSLPATPLLFMGQEWGASSPFLYFSDHEGELGEAVRVGRREEFKAFAAFAEPNARDAIPDPQAASTFERSKLVWSERTKEPHRRVLDVHRAMIALRRHDPVLGSPCRWEDLEAKVDGEVLEVIRRGAGAARRIVVSFASTEHAVPDADGWRLLFASGRFEDGKLGPGAAIVLASC